MSPSLHKVLAHGEEIAKSFPASIGFGMLTEEGAESKNKFYKKIRDYHTRKSSREDNMEDLFVRATLSSMPQVSNLRHKKTKESSSLPQKSWNMSSILDHKQMKQRLTKMKLTFLNYCKASTTLLMLCMKKVKHND